MVRMRLEGTLTAHLASEQNNKKPMSWWLTGEEVEPTITGFDIIDDCDELEPCHHTVMYTLSDKTSMKKKEDAHTIVGLLKTKREMSEHFIKYQTFTSHPSMKND